MTNILSYISTSSILLPLILLFFRFKLLTKDSLLIIIYVLLSFITESINFIIMYKFGNYTTVSSNFFTALEAILILLALYQWSLNYKNRFIYIILLSIYLFFWCYSIYVNGITKLSSMINGTEAVVVITASIYFLYNKFISETASNTKWQITFSIAFLYYFLVNSGVYSFTELFLNIEQPQNWIYYSWVHLIGNFGLNTILGVGIYQCSKQSFMV